MKLHDALDLCSDAHSDDWIRIPGGQHGRPATSMLAGIFDPGVVDEPATRPLAGHSLAVYEPDARLSLTWSVPEDDDYLNREESSLPARAATDSPQWKNARRSWAVVLLGGAPIWQDVLWFLDWGSGIGGYVADFQPI